MSRKYFFLKNYIFDYTNVSGHHQSHSQSVFRFSIPYLLTYLKMKHLLILFIIKLFGCILFSNYIFNNWLYNRQKLDEETHIMKFLCIQFVIKLPRNHIIFIFRLFYPNRTMKGFIASSLCIFYSYYSLAHHLPNVGAIALWDIRELRVQLHYSTNIR